MSFLDFLRSQEAKSRIWRLWEKRTPGDWTPLELEKKYTDQGHYVDSVASLIVIKEAFSLGDDIVIGYQVIFEYSDLKEENPIIYYKKLSQIDLAYYSKDVEDLIDGEY